jgi:hypothetical protein
MKVFLLLSLLITSSTWAGKILDESIGVNPYTLPGDSERTQLSLSGVRLHESNDFYGKTDKLVTEAMSLNVMSAWSKYFATSASYKGRYLTPVLKTKNGENPLPTPLGIHAEWVELSLNQSVTLFQDDSWGAIKLDGGFHYNDFGDHSFVKLYRGVHEAVGSPDETSKFGSPQDANFMSSSASGSVIIPFGEHINLIGSYQVMNSKIFREDAQEATLIWSVSKDLAFSAKYSFVKQIRSEYYDLKNNRTQYVGGVRLFKFWTPSIMYVSDYVKGDKHGQWYLSPVSFSYVF